MSIASWFVFVVLDPPQAHIQGLASLVKNSFTSAVSHVSTTFKKFERAVKTLVPAVVPAVRPMTIIVL